MTTPFAIVIAAVTSQIPVGYEFDAKSWQKGQDAKVVVTLITTNGKVNVGRFTLAGIAAPLDMQICLVESLKETGWDVRYGPNYTVIVFPPKGQSIKSIKIESNVWIPKYRRILAPLPIPKK